MPAVRLADLKIHEYDVGMVLPVGITYEQWAELVAGLQRDHKRAMWLMGDAFLFGSDKFNEIYAQAVENYSADTIDRVMRTCRYFPISRRRTCGFAHHQACEKLPEEVQDDLLDRCVREDWTREQMREAVREAKRPAPANDPPPETEPAPAEAEAERNAIAPEERLDAEAEAAPEAAEETAPAWLMPVMAPRHFFSAGEAVTFLREVAPTLPRSSIASAITLVLADRDKLLAIVEAVDQLPVMPPELVRALEAWQR